MKVRTTYVLVALTVGTVGCHKPTAHERRDGDIVSAVAERKPRDTGRELEHGESRRGTVDRVFDELQEAAEEVRREREDVAEAAARERVEYKKMLRKEIGAIDKRVLELQHELTRARGAAKDSKERDISAARGWRARLKADLDDIERTSENEWPELKERIEHDLDDERPAAVPRSFDKSYAI